MQFTSKWTLFNIMKYLLDIKYPKIPSPVEKKINQETILQCP